MSSDNKKHPWKNGFWLDKNVKGSVTYIDGETIESIGHFYLDHPDLKPTDQPKGILEFGDFGPAPAELIELSGIQNFNVKAEFGESFKLNFILNNEGTRMFGPKSNFQKNFMIKKWVNEDEFNEFKESREPADTPICQYAKLQPNNLGKIIWFSGPPGSGKSTTAQLIGRKHGYVYYEGDCFNSITNPFVDLNVDNPTLATLNQIPLKGASRDRIRRKNSFAKIKWGQPDQWDMDEVSEVLKSASIGIANDVLMQRKRIGGDWSVAFTVFSRKHRDSIRKILGSDVIFIVMNLTEDYTKKRILSRHGEAEPWAEGISKMALAFHKIHEKAEEDEENAYNIMIEENMTPDDVVDKVMDIISTCT